MTASRLADAIGAGLAISIACAAVISAQVNDAGDPWPVTASLAAAGSMYAAGRVLAPAFPALLGLVLASTAIVLVTDPQALAGGPLAPPLGYANANGAFYVLLLGLVAVAAVIATDEVWRASALAVAVALALLTAITASAAAFSGAVAVLGVLVAVLRGWHPKRWTALIACVAVILAAHVTALALGATYRPDDDRVSAVHATAATALSERRLELWADAVDMAADQPVTGAGPRTFPTTSPTAREDPDTAQTHSAILQMSAEVGWPGGVALLALLLWAATRPLVAAGRGRTPGVAIVTSTAVTAIAIHASVDYVLAFPVVVMATGILLGTGTALVLARRSGAVTQPVPGPGRPRGAL